MTEHGATALAPRLAEIVGASNVITDPRQLRTYECDGLTSHRATPGLAVLPATAEHVAAIVGVCADAGVPYVARGSGTGLSGGALPRADGVLVVTSRMRRIIEVDPANRRAVVEPGVTNLAVSKAAAPFGYFYAPDPSSQVVCSVGGNVAENSGGAHCLKYGFTVHHVLGLQVASPAGELVWIGDGTGAAPGYDLLGAFVGSEGTLGIATKIVVRLTRLPQTVYPPGAGAVLIVELDGPAAEVAREYTAVRELCEATGATEIRVADDPDERATIWKGRRAAFAAVGRISPAYIVQDGVVPRTALPEVLRKISRLSREEGIKVANVFHAGDGNLHPLVLYDDTQPGQAERAERLSGAILDACIEHGGSITGEHGVGVDKSRYMPKMFTGADLDTMQLLRCAFDPGGLCNPGKIFPTPRMCGEVPGVRRGVHPLVASGEVDMF